MIIDGFEVFPDGSPAVFNFDETNSKRYPKLQRCDVCNDPYSWDQVVKRLRCGLHSVHGSCENITPGVDCPKCQNSIEIFPLGDYKYIEGHRPEDMIITGFGRHWYNKDYHVLVNFHPEKREMYWYSLYVLRNKIGHAKVQPKLMQFLSTDVYKVQYTN
jgi:hypothetical protein